MIEYISNKHGFNEEEHFYFTTLLCSNFLNKLMEVKNGNDKEIDSFELFTLMELSGRFFFVRTSYDLTTYKPSLIAETELEESEFEDLCRFYNVC